MQDSLRLEVHDLRVPVLTGVYSEETHRPQPLRISISVELDCPAQFAPEDPLCLSKNYMDLKDAAFSTVACGRHFTLIESVADHISDALFRGDARVRTTEVKIVKLAIAEGDEAIGITLKRHRR
jgi:dihydroneopterin aldolase